MIDVESFAGKNEYPVVDAGTYEVVLSANVKNKKDGSGTYLNISYKIRDDVEQKFQGAYVFEKLGRDKNNPEWYDLAKSGSILLTQKGKPNYKTTFDEVDEFIQYINGISLVITVEKVYDDYLQKDTNRVKYGSYKPTTLADYVVSANKGSTTTETKNVDKVSVPEDDLPF